MPPPANAAGERPTVARHPNSACSPTLLPGAADSSIAGALARDPAASAGRGMRGEGREKGARRFASFSSYSTSASLPLARTLRVLATQSFEKRRSQGDLGHRARSRHQSDKLRVVQKEINELGAEIVRKDPRGRADGAAHIRDAPVALGEAPRQTGGDFCGDKEPRPGGGDGVSL